MYENVTDPGSESATYTTEEILRISNHKAGPGCRCKECERLKNLEDKWITRLGTYHSPHGLNERDEIIRKARVTY